MPAFAYVDNILSDRDIFCPYPVLEDLPERETVPEGFLNSHSRPRSGDLN